MIELGLMLLLQADPFDGLKEGDRIEVTFATGRQMTGWITKIGEDHKSLRLDVSHDFPELQGTMKVEAFKVKAVKKLAQIDPEEHKRRVEEAERRLEEGEGQRTGREADQKKIRALPFEGQTLTAQRGPFKLITDTSRPLADGVLDDLESAFKEFAALLPGGGLPEYAVLIYATEQSFATYYEKVMGWKWEPVYRGFYDPRDRALVLFGDTPGLELKAVVRHEGFHAYFDGFGVASAPWMNEGLAVQFEVGSATRASELEMVRLGGALVSGEELRAVGHEAFHRTTVAVVRGTTEYTVPRYYAAAGSWCRFLIDSGNGAIFSKILTELKSGRTAGEAWSQATQGLDTAALDDQWRTSLGPR